MDIGTEALEIVHADDGVELSVVRGKLPHVISDHPNLSSDTGAVNDIRQLIFVDPSVERRHRGTCLASQEDGRRVSAAPGIEYSIAGTEC